MIRAFTRFFKESFNFNPAAQGILGINGRNVDYVLRNNSRKYYPMVDDKLETKKLAAAAGIPSPEVYGVIERHNEIEKLSDMIAGKPDFVVKPSRGSGGGGIVVVAEYRDDLYYKAGGGVIQEQELYFHITNILGGLYSLAGANDSAIIEYRVEIAKLFENIVFKGVPDIRIIIYHGYPVMAMLRLPTRQSDGKANLHSGGLGAGLSIKTGQTTHTVKGTHYIETHPDTRAPLRGVQIPDWSYFLEAAARFHEILPLRYIGVDLVIDETRGPMLLEVNARPGLGIQIANRAGLIPRLQTIEALKHDNRSPAERVQKAQALFD